VLIGFLAVFLSPLPFLMLVLGLRYLYLVLLADLGFLAAIYQLLARNNPTNLQKCSRSQCSLLSLLLLPGYNLFPAKQIQIKTFLETVYQKSINSSG